MISSELLLYLLSACCLLAPYMVYDNECESFKHFSHFYNTMFLHRYCWKNTVGGSPALPGCGMGSMVGSGISVMLCPNHIPWMYCPSTHSQPWLSWLILACHICLWHSWHRYHMLQAFCHNSTSIPLCPCAHQPAAPPYMFQRTASCLPSNHKPGLAKQTSKFFCHPVGCNHIFSCEFWTQALGRGPIPSLSFLAYSPSALKYHREFIHFLKYLIISLLSSFNNSLYWTSSV